MDNDLGKDDSKKIIVATYLETGSIKETATILHYSFSWVYKVLSRLGVISIKLKKHKYIYKELSCKDTYKLISDYLNGTSTNLILNSYNISSSTLYFILNQHKIPARNSKRGFNWSSLSKEDKAYISAGVICAAAENMAETDIAKQMSIPVSRVKIILQTLTNKKKKAYENH